METRAGVAVQFQRADAFFPGMLLQFEAGEQMASNV
jgi:hypothetical protein